jgi:outer membrane immunogenic protein
MRLRLLLLAAGSIIAAALGNTPSSAQQLADGSGALNFGVFLQGTVINADVVEIEAGPPPVVDDGSVRITGFGGGASFGYDHRIGAFVLGAIADISFDGGSKTYAGIDYGTNFLATIRARLGMNVSRNILLYVTLGGAFLGAEAKYVVPPVVGPAKVHHTFRGFTIGGGLDYAMNDHVSLFGEYLFANFDTFRFTGGGPVLDVYTVDPEAHIFRFGIRFRYSP